MNISSLKLGGWSRNGFEILAAHFEVWKYHENGHEKHIMRARNFQLLAEKIRRNRREKFGKYSTKMDDEERNLFLKAKTISNSGMNIGKIYILVHENDREEESIRFFEVELI